MESSMMVSELFHLEEIKDYLLQTSYKNIALQFPDSQLDYSTDVYLELIASFPDRYFYVLGDTQYAECCIDDVNASHLSVNDLIIHFGHCCLSTASKSPIRPDKEILYVITQSTFTQDTITKLTQEFMSIMESQFKEDDVIYVLADIEIEERVKEFVRQDNGECSKKQQRIVVGSIDRTKFKIVPRSVEDETRQEAEDLQNNQESFQILGRRFKQIENSNGTQKVMIYIGNDEKFLNTLSLNIGTDFSLYDLNPESLSLTQQAISSLNKKLIQRYAMIEKVKEAEVIGILIGTVVVDSYMQIIQDLKLSIINSGKKFYEVLIGKLNEPKLKNFQFIDLYVVVSCPETSVIDPKLFNIPVVTPHELFMGLEEDHFQWESKIITDFRQLLPKLREIHTPSQIEQIQSHTYSQDESSMALVKKEHQELVPVFSSQIIQRYENLSYKGLEISTEKAEVKKIQKGMTGIASSYDKDQKVEQKDF